MDEAPITNLEAELSCFEPGLPPTTPRQGHGSSDTFFDAPTDTTSRLEPPSKTKSVYPLGEDGTLAWTTPAGELLSVANVIGNRLVGVEYKKSIERGQGYDERGKMLERVVKASQGSGYGIGLSLDVKIFPTDVFWIHNRWPRYTYQYNGLEIRLQYYIESQLVIQQYQIRNNGQSDALMPYVMTSDVCFREHKRPSGIAQPVPSAKCPDRLLLIQNSEVLIRNLAYRAQSEMALFFNGERQSLWADGPLADRERDSADFDDTENIRMEIEEAEETMRNIIHSKRLLSRAEDDSFKYLYRRHYDRYPGDNETLDSKQKNFATYRNDMVISPGSTQELTAIIQISSFTGPEAASKVLGSSNNAENGQRTNSDEELMMDSIWDAQDRLAARAENLSFGKADSRSKRRISELVKDHIELGESCSEVKWIGEARFYFHGAYLIAESFSKDDLHTWNYARFAYAKFLDDNGWYGEALSIVKELVPDLFGGDSRDGDIIDLWTVVINRIGSIFLKNGYLMEAQTVYQKGLDHYSKNTTDLNTDSAHFLERVALTQVYQEQDREAHASYTRLLGQDLSARPIILSNLGFIERRLRQYSEAKKHYECSLKESKSEADNVLARSGLSTCLRGLDADPLVIANIWPSSILYVDVNSALSLSPSLVSPFREGPFSFAIARQLESLLSVCSIPLKDDQSPRGIAIMDADPLNCLYEGRVAYFQFRFLIQCQLHLTSMQKNEDGRRCILERIHSVCEGHLIWVFRIADSTNTWSPYYTISGSNTAEEVKHSSIKPTLAYSVEGAFHFLKLCLYLHMWSEKWLFVLDLMHLKLRDWLLYLERNQHMANLWVEDEDLESFKPYNTTSEDVGYIRRTYPHYHLSDAALIWLALLHVEKTIKTIEDRFRTQTPRNADSIESMLKDIRQYFDASQGNLSLQQIQSNILKTFKVPRERINAPFSAGESAGTHRTVANTGESDILAMQSSSPSVSSGFQATEARLLSQAEAARKRDQQIIVFQRTINQSMLEIEPSDCATIEASILGIFEGSQGHVDAAWRDTLNLQKDKEISTIEDPRQLALIIFACRFKYNLASSRVGKIEDVAKDRLQHALYDSGIFAQKIMENAPEPMRDWTAFTYETMSLLIGALFKDCRDIFQIPGRQENAQPAPNALSLLMAGSRPPTRLPISMPGAVNPSSRMNQTNVVDTDFLPDWMYHYPDFIHKKKLEIDVGEKLHQLSSVKSLALTITQWNTSRNFNTGKYWTIPFEPGVVDSGIKKRIGPNQTLAEREISISDYYYRNEFWERLLQPRTPAKAKKRVVELSSQDKESVLICWLSASEEEKPLFLEFFRRHESSESFFGERAHWQGNVWETEFHLGFHELLTVEIEDDSDDDSRSAESLDKDSGRQHSHRQTSNQPFAPNPHEIKPVALGFRFVGDLRDRFWTCHFFSSVTDGFSGIIHEHYRFGSTRDKLHAERQGQRKVLELTYVEKALGELRRSIDKILAAFEKDLEAPESKDPANESFVFIHDYSSLYMEIGGKLRNVSQQLDASLSTIEQWERREEARGLRSRWSQKDEERHGGKLRDLTMKCKFTVQQLRVQQGRLREQRRIADQRHNNLVSYKQLQEARTSTQSAADVRLFTYVTIIFLPLSFSSSLFSMGGAPKGSTISVMVPTTAVALTITFLLIANLKLMDRHWSFWVNRLNARTREQMKGSEQSQKWKDISRQLEETTQRRLIKSNFEQGLPAESNWWYIKFWLSYAIQRTSIHAHNGVRAWEAYDKMSISRPHRILAALFLTIICVLILITYTTIMMTVDTIHLQWIMVRHLGRKMLNPDLNNQSPKEKGAEPNLQGEDRTTTEESNTKATTKANELKRHGRLRTAIKSLIAWLESSPRPIRDYIKKMDSTLTDPSEKDDALAEETATLYDEAIGSQPNKAMILSLLAATTSFIGKFLPQWRTPSTTEHSEKGDSAIVNGKAPEMHFNGLQNAAQRAAPEYFPPRPRRKRKLLKRSRATGPETGEPRVFMSWSSA